MSGTLDWDDFLVAFRRAAAPRSAKGRPNRRVKAGQVLPPLVLAVPHHADAVDAALRSSLRRSTGNAVAHVEVAPLRPGGEPPGSAWPLAMAIDPEDLRQGVARATGRLRLTNYTLMRNVLVWAREGSDAPLRDFCHQHRGSPAVLDALADPEGAPPPPAPGGLSSWLLWLGSPAFRRLARWAWGRRLDRRLLRGTRRQRWYARLVGGEGRITGERFFHHVQRRVEELLRGGDGAPPVHRVPELERMLLHALMADLNRWARPGRLSPWRYRRVTRFVFLSRLGADDDVAAWQRFLDAFASAGRETGCGVALWVVVSPVGASLKGEESSPDEAAGLLRGERKSDGRRPLIVRADAETVPPAADQLAVQPGGRPEVAPGVLCAAYALSLALVAGSLSALVWPDDTGCLGGTHPANAAQPPPTRAVDLPALYEQARELIARENDRADEAARRGETVRTLVHVASRVTEEESQAAQRSDGAVPELRGIALAQRQLNDEAGSDDQKVWLRVEVRDAGPRYENAPQVAREIAAEAAAGSGIVGVVGFRQSRYVTLEAIRVLGEAGIPTVATTATADELATSEYYHALAPRNSREAAIAVEFVRQGNVVERGAGVCAPAGAALIVQDPTDLYSRGLGDAFATEFGERGGSWRKLWYARDPEAAGDAEVPPAGPRVTEVRSLQRLADTVCEQVRREPDTVVYWTARSREFQGFLNDFGPASGCEGEQLTVVGGNELTNAAFSGQFDNPPWLRFYFSSRTLPAGHPGNSDTSVMFQRDYAREFGEDDLWRHDGHQALAYDALQVLAAGINEASAATGAQDISRSTVQLVLHRGVTREGASGHLDFGVGSPASRDKPLVILHHTDVGAEAVLHCGAFAEHTGQVTRWGPGDAHPCPRDE
ncbi:hypothetical protein [Streptomyces sp. SBT349]|uniref:hypothetical protein n=1 Tax=Streptomyces sp. SBT349 TaxID=1580539 RepID=UPI00066E6869|nr:hypothetical protein [Streptomyces sp. SBT349]